MSTIALLGCVGQDPPDDGFILLSIVATNANASDVSGLRLKAHRVDAVLSDEPSGDARTIALPDTEGTILEFGEGETSYTDALIPVRPGYLHQLRFIVDGVEIRHFEPGDDAIAKVPSGSTTGIKVVPRDGVPFEIRSYQTTAVQIQLAIAEQVVRPPGLGHLFKPVLDAELVASSDFTPVVSGQVLVRFASGVARVEQDEVVRRFDARAAVGQLLLPELNLITVEVPGDRSLPEAIAFFARHDRVEYAGPRILFTPGQENPRPPDSPDDPSYPNQDYLVPIKAPAAWDTQIGTRSVIVAVLDTGLDLSHPDIVDNLFLNEGEIPDEVTIQDADKDGLLTFVDLNHPDNAGAVADTNGNGIIDGVDVRARVSIDAAGVNRGGLADGIDNDFIDGDTTNIVDDLTGARIGTFDPPGQGPVIQDNLVDDDQTAVPGFPIDGHGTAVAGLIGATGHNGLAVTGVAWRVRILPIKVCDRARPGEGFPLPACDSTILLTRAMHYARRLGVSISNFSLGATQVLPGTATERDIEIKVMDIGAGLYEDGLFGQSEPMLNVIAAGNGVDVDGDGVPEGQDCDGLHVLCVPGEYRIGNKVVVGATDNARGRTAFSNFGTSAESGVHMGAPGQDMLALRLGGGTQDNLDGTSFSTPLVSGAAALLMSQAPGLGAPGARDVLLGSALVEPLLNDEFAGGRFLDVEAAVLAAP